MSSGNVTSPVFFPQAERSFLDPLPPVATEPPVDPLDPAAGQWWEGGASSEAQRPSEHRSGAPAGLGNTAIYSSLDDNLSGGIDWLEGSIYGSYSLEVYEETEQLLETARREAEQGGSGRVEVQGATLFVRRGGHRWGNTFFPWVVETDGVVISLGRSSQSDKCAVAKVLVGSYRLMRDGPVMPWEQSLRLLATLGVSYERSVCTRVDGCLDMPGQSVEPFCRAVQEQQTISRLKSDVKVHYGPDGRFTGFSAGNRKGVFVNVYDKQRELEAKPGIESDAKRQLLQETRWGGNDPGEAARVEFQIKGDWIRNRWDGVGSVEDVLQHLPAIVDHLVTSFFRIVDGPVDRDNKHQSRAVMSPLWVRVCEGFRSWLGRAGELRKKPKNTLLSVEHRVRRMVGAVRSYLAARGPDAVWDKETAFTEVVNELSRVFDDNLVQKHLQPVWEKWSAAGIRVDHPPAATVWPRFIVTDQFSRGVEGQVPF